MEICKPRITEQEKDMRKIGIIGGGASGLAAAIAAARQEHTEVFILEHKEKAGRKLLSTGNGRCNLTNERMDASFFRGGDREHIGTVLGEFGYEDTIYFFEGLGLMMKSRNGYIYPRCDQASAVRELLEKEALRLGVSIHTGMHVTGVFPGRKGFRIAGECLNDGTGKGNKTYRKEVFHADKVILACGGCAASTLGSDGSGYAFAKSLGHTLVPVVPALVQLKVKGNPFKNAAGVRTEAKVTAFVDGKRVSEDTGEIQITSYGISGIPVFQISRYLARALYEKQRAEAAVDFLPSMREEEFTDYLTKRFKGRKEQTVSDALLGIFHTKLLVCLLSISGISAKRKVEVLLKEDLFRFARTCKHTLLPIQDTNGYDNAQVCAGGVCLREIEPRTMESCYVPGLYFAGELLDVDGMCGGYNLQWAWSTGYLAGYHAGSGKS